MGGADEVDANLKPVKEVNTYLVIQGVPLGFDIK